MPTGRFMQQGDRAGEPLDIEVADVVLGGSAIGLQFLAQHKRKLEDTGLSTYAGNEVVLAIIFLAGALALVVGGILASSCDNGKETTACQVGRILVLLGLLAMAIASFASGNI